MTSLRFGSATDAGLVRANNEDCYLVAEPLFAVADGMGGHAAGEVASATAVESLRAAFTDHTADGLEAAARAANRAVWEEAQGSPDLRGMGTTLVALALIGSPDHEQLAVAHVGDSRLYRLHHGEITQLTSDHSLVGQMVASGALTPEEAEVHPRRNILTRALGVDPDVDVDVITFDVEEGDRYLLCSDGLSRELTDNQTAAILRRLADPDEAARVLVREAKEHGGNDNVTVVVIDVGAPALASDTEAPTLVPGVGLAGDTGPGEDTAAGKEPDEPTTVLPLADLAPGAPAAAPASPPPTKLGWRQRQKARRQAMPHAKLVTIRVIAFFVLLLALAGIAIGGVAIYARHSYFVGLEGKQIVIFQGRPDGVLWFEPTVAARPDVTTHQVLPVHLPELRAGKVIGSLTGARQYVDNLHRQYLAARAANTPSTTVPSTTVPTLPTTEHHRPGLEPGTTSLPAATVPTVPRTPPAVTAPATTAPRPPTTPPPATPPTTAHLTTAAP